MIRKLAFLSEATQFGLLLRSKRKDQKGRAKRKLASLSEATRFGLLLRGKRRSGEFRFQGVAQLVARSVRDAEVVGSSPITLTREETSGMRLVFCCGFWFLKLGLIGELRLKTAHQ